MRDAATAPTYVIAFAVTALALAGGTVARAAMTVGPTWVEPAAPAPPSHALATLLGLPADETEGSGVAGVDEGSALADAALPVGAAEGSEPPAPAGSGAGSEDGSGEGSALADDEPPIPGLVPIPTEEELAALSDDVPEIVSDEPELRRIDIARRHEDGPCRVSANRAVVVREIRRREPVETRGPFYADGFPTIVYLDTQNTTGRRQRMTVQWVHDASGTVYRNRLNAGPSHRWRTWAERPLPLSQLGPWTVEVLDDDRCLITSLSFSLQAPSW